jgi:Ca2+-binding RTX toxin-like protein
VPDGGAGRDVIDGGAGRDRIDVVDGGADRVTCGTGRDSVIADSGDRTARDCERMVRVRGR